jgi:serine/threonine-protein kinase
MQRHNLVGMTLSKYHCDAFIGLGGMAEVYRATDTELNRSVALKVLHPFLVAEEGFIDRFRREAQALAALRHPNIVQIYDSGLEDFNSYVVMEYIAGPTLKDRLRELSVEGRQMPLEEVQRIFKALVAALRYAHGQGIVHRDLKPSNVLLSEDGRVVLTDFGLAKIVGSTIHTASLALVGTPAYMAPEQARSSTAEPSSDVYALGVILFELLAGRLPFTAETPFEMINKHSSEALPNVGRDRRDVPAGLDRVLKKATAKDARDRFQNVDQFEQAFNAAFEGKRRIPFVSLRPDWLRALPNWVTLTAVAIVLLGLGGMGGLFNANAPSPTPTLTLAPTATPELLRALIIGDVNLYEEPDFAARVIARLTQDTEVVLLNRNGLWWQVRVVQNGLVGWVIVSALDIIPPTLTPTLTNTPPPGASLTPTPTSTPTPTITPVPPSPTPSFTPSDTPTETPDDDDDGGGSPPSPTPTQSPTATPTPTGSLSPTHTVTLGPSGTPTFTPTGTISPTLTPTRTESPAPTNTFTPTATPSLPPTATYTSVPTFTPGPTATGGPTPRPRPTIRP